MKEIKRCLKNAMSILSTGIRCAKEDCGTNIMILEIFDDANQWLNQLRKEIEKMEKHDGAIK